MYEGREVVELVAHLRGRLVRAQWPLATLLRVVTEDFSLVLYFDLLLCEPQGMVELTALDENVKVDFFPQLSLAVPSSPPGLLFRGFVFVRAATLVSGPLLLLIFLRKELKELAAESLFVLLGLLRVYLLLEDVQLLKKVLLLLTRQLLAGYFKPRLRAFR